MNWNARTLLRGFLLVGGLFFLGAGLVRGELFDVGVGGVAAALGGFGLWWEYNRQSSAEGE